MARSRNRSVFSQGPSRGVGARLTQFFLVLIALVIVGGVVFLGFWDLQPPSEMVEKVIPDESLPR
ncbi:hypothetical protein [Inquilinus sp. CAU 1745]|uniref:hypothetical protein n=1 Tax=Inquilinus sp. CAU 1745 TaxID=3140369 RepID=UPI00325AA5D6